MKQKNRNWMLAGVTAVLAPLASMTIATGSAHAQDIDARKQMRIIVPYAAGGTSDILGRKLAEELSRRLDRPVIVENRAGAGGAIGTEATVRSDPDGATILLHSGAIATEPALKSKLPYDVTKDLSIVTTAVEGPFAVLVAKDVPANTIGEFIEYAKAQPNGVNFGTPGVGTSVHLASELLKVQGQIPMEHVPYKGASAALAGLMGGEIQLVIDPLATAKRYSEDGRVKALAVTSAQRTDLWPEMVTVAETGIPEHSGAVWYGLYVPSATDDAVVAGLNKQFVDILNSNDMKAWLTSQGLQPVGNTPEQATQYLVTDIERWKQVVKEAGIPVQ